MALSNKQRFAIFERDGFTCQYCGQKPPDVVLQVDHVVSKKDGGGDEEMNLLTSCFACNNGKSSKSVDLRRVKSQSFRQELELLEARKGQLEAYYNFLKRKAEVEQDEVNIYQRCWEEASDGNYSLTAKGLKDMRNLSQRYPSEMIFQAVRIAWENPRVEPGRKFSYLCGVLKNMKLRQDDPERADRVRLENRMMLAIKGRYAYVNEHLVRGFLARLDEDEVRVLLDNARNWTEFKALLLSQFGDAED